MVLRDTRRIIPFFPPIATHAATERLQFQLVQPTKRKRMAFSVASVSPSIRTKMSSRDCRGGNTEKMVEAEGGNQDVECCGHVTKTSNRCIEREEASQKKHFAREEFCAKRPPAQNNGANSAIAARDPRIQEILKLHCGAITLQSERPTRRSSEPLARQYLRAVLDSGIESPSGVIEVHWTDSVPKESVGQMFLTLGMPMSFFWDFVRRRSELIAEARPPGDNMQSDAAQGSRVLTSQHFI